MNAFSILVLLLAVFTVTIHCKDKEVGVTLQNNRIIVDNDRWVKSLQVEGQKEVSKAKKTIEYLNHMLQSNGSFSWAPKKEQGSNDDWFGCQAIYGQYCGPGYCDEQWWDGCDGRHADMHGCSFNAWTKNAVDSCCAHHDQMCVASRDTGDCTFARENMVRCLQHADCGLWPLCETMRQSFSLFFSTRPGCC